MEARIGMTVAACLLFGGQGVFGQAEPQRPRYEVRRAAAHQREDQDRGWSLEMAIPWANFSDMARVPQAGTVFTANLNRWDGVEPNRRLSLWSDSRLDWPHPHAPAQFGDLVFVK